MNCQSTQLFYLKSVYFRVFAASGSIINYINWCSLSNNSGIHVQEKTLSSIIVSELKNERVCMLHAGVSLSRTVINV